MSAGIYSVYRHPVKPRTKGLRESEVRDSRTFELVCKLRFNVIGLGDRLRNEACAKPVLGGEANS